MSKGTQTSIHGFKYIKIGGKNMIPLHIKSKHICLNGMNQTKWINRMRRRKEKVKEGNNNSRCILL